MPRARRTDPSSSHDAASAVARSGIAKAQCSSVLAALRRYKHRTSNELAHDSGIDRYIVARRLPELRKRNLVNCSGEAQKRKDHYSGRDAMTWWPV
jgi:DNA-binding MarR family transcriptional regulator